MLAACMACTILFLVSVLGAVLPFYIVGVGVNRSKYESIYETFKDLTDKFGMIWAEGSVALAVVSVSHK